MRAKVTRVTGRRDGITLTLSFSAPAGERTGRYRLTEADYEALGSPSEGAWLSEEEHLPFTEEKDTRAAYERAIRILSFGDNTATALCRKLSARGFTRDEVEAAVARVLSEGYIREEDMLLRQFAVFASKCWGPRKYGPWLSQKGFSRDRVAAAAARAEREGIYSAAAVRAALLARCAEEDEDTQRSILQKHGFSVQ